MAKVQINFEKLTPFGEFFRSGAISYIPPIQHPRYFSSSYAYIKKMNYYRF